MQTPSVFQYQSAQTYLGDAIQSKRQIDPAFSMRRFCKSTDFGSHAHLIMILKGKRRLTLKQVPALSTGFSLSPPEQVFLQTLIQLDSARTEEERDLYRLWLNDLNPRKEHRILEVEQYHVIADWIHMAILTLAKIPHADLSPETIHRAVSGKVSLVEIREAKARLFDLGLLQVKDGSIVPGFESVRSKDDVANRGARTYHKQVAQLAIQAVDEQSPDLREFQSFALNLPRAKISLAKDLIRKFRHQFVQLLEAEPGEDVYQCNLQFFRLAENPSPVAARSKAKHGREDLLQSPSLDNGVSYETI